MKTWLAIPATLVASAAVLWAANPDPQGGSSTASYEHQKLGPATAVAESASKGGSYGRVDEVGAPAVLETTAGGVYLPGAGVASLEGATPGVFAMSGLAPNAGLPSTVVIVPKADGLDGSLTVRFDGALASPMSSPNPDWLKVQAPTHAPGPVDVTVDGATKSITFEAGFAYIPAVHVPAEIGLGDHLQIRVYGNPGAFFGILYAEGVGSSFTIPGVSGALSLDLATILDAGQAVVPSTLPGGAETREGMLEFDMPQTPSLKGKTFYVQAVTYDAQLPGSPFAFTNVSAIQVKN